MGNVKPEEPANTEGERRPPDIYICPFCGGDRWIGLGGDSVGEAITPVPVFLAEINEVGRPSLSVGHVVVALACTGCGFVRAHDPNAIGK